MANALFDVGISLEQQTLEAELRKLIQQHGPVVVRKTAERLCKAKVGRKAEKDWLQLKDVIYQDAADWLSGKDPRLLRSNNAIASDFSDKHPGHNRASTHRRIMGKLAKKRESMFLITAWQMSEAEWPFADYFRASQALADLGGSLGELALSLADTKRGVLARYRDAHGEPPKDMTVAAISEKMARQSPMTLNALMPLSGMIGQSRQKRPG